MTNLLQRILLGQLDQEMNQGDCLRPSIVIPQGRRVHLIPYQFLDEHLPFSVKASI